MQRNQAIDVAADAADLFINFFPVSVRIFTHLNHVVGSQVGTQGQSRLPGQGSLGVRHLSYEGFVRQWHGKTANGVFFKSLIEITQSLSGLDFQAIIDQPGLTGSLSMLVPNSQAVHTDVGLLDISHAEADQASPLLHNVNPVGGEHWLVVEEEFKLWLRNSSNKSRESGSHSSKYHFVSNFLQEFWGIIPASLHKFNNLQGSAGFSCSLLVLGHTSIAAAISLSNLLYHQHTAHAIGFNLMSGIFLNRLAIEEPRNFRPGVRVDF